jgi:hypothetical protein
MTCQTNYEFVNGLCYGPCISGWEPNTEDLTTCVEIGCSSYTVPSSGNPNTPATCEFDTYAYTNEYCEKLLTNDAACGCPQLYSDNGSGACQKFSKQRTSRWPSCSLFEHYDGHECALNPSFFIFILLLLLLIIIFSVFMSKRQLRTTTPQKDLFPNIQTI